MMATVDLRFYFLCLDWPLIHTRSPTCTSLTLLALSQYPHPIIGPPLAGMPLILYVCVLSDFLLLCLRCHNFSRLFHYVYVRVFWVCLTFLWIVVASLVWTIQLLIMTNLTGMPQIAGCSAKPPCILAELVPSVIKCHCEERLARTWLYSLLGYIWIYSKMLYWLHRLMKNKVWGKQLKESKTSIYRGKKNNQTENPIKYQSATKRRVNVSGRKSWVCRRERD